MCLTTFKICVILAKWAYPHFSVLVSKTKLECSQCALNLSKYWKRIVVIVEIPGWHLLFDTEGSEAPFKLELRAPLGYWDCAGEEGNNCSSWPAGVAEFGPPAEVAAASRACSFWWKIALIETRCYSVLSDTALWCSSRWISVFSTVSFLQFCAPDVAVCWCQTGGSGWASDRKKKSYSWQINVIKVLRYMSHSTPTTPTKQTLNLKPLRWCLLAVRWFRSFQVYCKGVTNSKISVKMHFLSAPDHGHWRCLEVGWAWGTFGLYAVILAVRLRSYILSFSSVVGGKPPTAGKSDSY